MSASYDVNGHIILKVKLIGRDVSCSQSTTDEEIANLIKENIENRIGNCELIAYRLELKRTS